MTKKYNKEISAAKSGMSSKTARKYIKANKLPSEIKQQRHWKTRVNIFEEEWDSIESMLLKSPRLQAKTILVHLMSQYPNKFNNSHERTLQRLIRKWRAKNGADKNIIFCQHIQPGKQSQCDYTSMNKLGIKISGEEFEHLLFHFMLPYSRWEWVSVCYSESFASLSKGYEDAVWALGYVAPEHRTDNLSAASKVQGNKRVATTNWQEFMQHYEVIATRNNPGESHENGSVEKSHDLLKNDIEQQLMLRGSSNFKTLEDYEQFLQVIVSQRNSARHTRLNEEIKLLNPLPEQKYYAPDLYEVIVSKFSTIRIQKVTYSVPSRLIGYNLRACVYQEEIKLYYGDQLVQSMPDMSKSGSSVIVNYRHIINSLIRKPGAFNNYYYRESLFPTIVFRKAFDLLIENYPANGIKQYLGILQLSAIGKESDVAFALNLLISKRVTPSIDRVKDLLRDEKKITFDIKVNKPSIAEYDLLLTRTAWGVA